MSKLPNHVAKFFWDIEPFHLNLNKDLFFIIERILEYGDDKSLKWLRNNYNDKDLVDVVKKSKKISKKTANIWRIYYDLKPEEITCLKRYYNQNNNVFWNL